MLAQHYAQALYQLHGDSDQVVQNLIAVLKQKGHLALLPTIVREYTKLLQERGKSGEAVIRVAKREHLDTLKHVLQQHEKELNFKREDAVVVEDPAVVGGLVVEYAGVEIDGSYRARLVELYRKLVAVSI